MSAPAIHPSAIIEAGAQIGEDCRTGPLCVFVPQVVLGRGFELTSPVVRPGATHIDQIAVPFSSSSIGEIPRVL